VDAAERAVIQADCVPVDMKHFCADERPPAQVCQEAVLNADVFVGIVGFRYGSPVRDRPELSYVELEFQEASKAGMPCWVFLLGKQTLGPAELFWDPDYGARQEAFRHSLPESGITVKTIASPDDLRAELCVALVKSDRGEGTVGWRGSVVAVPPLLRSDVVERPGLMAQLVRAVIRPGAGVVGMTIGLWGAGGFGTTTLCLRHTYWVTSAARGCGSVVSRPCRLEGLGGMSRESGPPPGSGLGVSLAGAGCALGASSA
jgi:hypothetical protein